MEQLLIKTLTVGPLQANCYLIACPRTRRTAIIDPGGDAGVISDTLSQSALLPEVIINTHAHPDHTGANAALARRFTLPIWLHEEEKPILAQAAMLAGLIGLPREDSPLPARLLRDGEVVEMGGVRLEVIHTPGHSPGGICLFSPEVEDAAPCLFSGDTLFAGSIGRSDLPGGSHRELMRSLRERLMSLPKETVVYPGHGPETTIGREKRFNPPSGLPPGF